MTKPTKEKIRAFMEKRVKSKTPPPSPEQTRRELGWDLIGWNRKSKAV